MIIVNVPGRICIFMDVVTVLGTVLGAIKAYMRL